VGVACGRPSGAGQPCAGLPQVSTLPCSQNLWRMAELFSFVVDPFTRLGMSIMAFLKQFPNDDACWHHLQRVRWPHGPVCAKCGNLGPTIAVASTTSAKLATPNSRPHLGRRSKARICRCGQGSRRCTCSPFPARDFPVSFQLGVCQKTAWFLGHRICAMMEDNCRLLRGLREADQTAVGGNRKRDRKSRRDDDGDQPKGRGGKAMVVTAGERGGKSRAKRAHTQAGRAIRRRHPGAGR
jgi:Transposase zinc-ribbon domain